MLAGRLPVAQLRERGGRGIGLGGVLELDLEPLSADAVLQLVRSAFGDHPPVVDHGDPVGEPVRLVQVLGGEQHGGARRDAVLDGLPQAQAAARVEPGGRLVQEQHLRLRHQRSGEVEPAPHAAGVRAHDPAAPPRAGRTGRAGPRRAPGRAAPEVVEAAHHLEVLLAGQVLVDGRVLAGQPDVRAQPGRIPHHVEARDLRRAAVGRQQRREDAHRGRLAGAVGTEQSQHRARGRAQVDAAQRLDVAVRLAQAVGLDCGGLGQVFNRSNRLSNAGSVNARGPPRRASPATHLHTAGTSPCRVRCTLQRCRE